MDFGEGIDSLPERNKDCADTGKFRQPSDVHAEQMGKHMASTLKACLVSAAVMVGAATVASTAVAYAVETQLERGAYLMNGIVACGNCHTPKDQDGRALPDQELAGGLVFDRPVFRAVVPNITPDNYTGIGKWTDEQLVDAIRNGRRPDGTVIGPPMPIEFYRSMSDTDVLAIVAYMRAVKPVSNKLEKSTFKIPLPASIWPDRRPRRRCAEWR